MCLISTNLFKYSRIQSNYCFCSSFLCYSIGYQAVRSLRTNLTKNHNNNQKNQIWKNTQFHEAITETDATKYAQITFAKHKRTVGAIITIWKSTSIMCTWTISRVTVPTSEAHRLPGSQHWSLFFSFVKGKVGDWVELKSCKRPQISDVFRAQR